ncbi:hypothetical protein WG954_08510 [Lacibacter sp. H375]|uniref:hypothetical protein n=1 Tax=Lacibacter sp. H375 TaxID=3133424 RepID=UPI0030C47F68
MMKKWSYYLLVLLTGIFFLFYISTRAHKLSITHDESSTTNVVDGSYNDIMFSSSMFGSANNHIVNSLLLKKSVALFGWHEWSIRLPNVLSFVIYFLAIVFLVGNLCANSWIRLAAIFFLCASHFILDYFSLARGYGIAVAFEMMSLYLLIQFFSIRKINLLLFSFLFAAIAAYANFTWLNMYLAQWLVFNLILLLDRKEESAGLFVKKIVQLNIYPLVVILVLTILIYKPIGYLSGNNEFKWGSDTWLASFHSFVSNLHYSRSDYFLMYDTRIFLLKIIVAFIFFAGCLLLIQRLFRNRWQQVKVFPYYALLIGALLIVVLIVSTILQRYLLNTFFIDGRKALLYVPVLLLLFAGLVTWVLQYYPATGKTVWFLAYATGLIHLMSIFNFYSCNEWWYDASSKMAYQYITSDISNQSKTTAVNWLFSQSMDFYNKRMFNNAIPVLNKTNELKSFDEVNYVYTLGDEIRSVPPQFKPVKRYLWDRFVLKRDTIAYAADVYSFILQQKINNPAAMFTYNQWKQKADSALVQKRRELDWSYLLYSE